MDDITKLTKFYEFTQSVAYGRISISFALISLVFAVGLVALAFAYFGRGRENTSIQPAVQPWVLVIATLRDSFLITILYLSEDFLYRYTSFVDSATTKAPIFLIYLRQAEPFLGILLLALIFAIAFIRITALTHWLTAQKTE